MNRLSVDDRALLLHALCEGMSLRSCERVFQRPLKTIQKIVRDVGDWAINYLANERPVTCERLQADELWSFVGENDRRTALSRDRSGRGVYWTYLAVDRDTKLVVAYHIGSRQAVDATKFMRKLDQRLAKDDNGDFVCMPTIAVDGMKAYVDAIEIAFGNRVNAGAYSKQYTKVDADGEALPGSRFAGAARLTIKGNPAFKEINTWLVERENGFVRQSNRRFTRKTNAFSKVLDYHERQIAIMIVYRNYCWEPAPSRPADGGRWIKRNTPAIVAGLTDHVWSPREMIEFSDAYLASREPLEGRNVQQDSRATPFWVNHKPYHRDARVHTAECSSCNNGLGKNRGPVKGSLWSGFDSLEAATRYAAHVEPDNHAQCRLCLAGYHTRSTFGRRS